MSNKRIALKLEFYLRGRTKIPSVSFIGMDGYGVPMTPSFRGKTPPDKELVKQNKAFDEFNAAAHKFCQEMAKAGELK